MKWQSKTYFYGRRIMKSFAVKGCIGFLLMTFIAVNGLWAQEKVTPQEIIVKVKEGAEFLAKAGEPGLAEFKDPKGRWVWKDTYLVVEDCEKNLNVAHPLNPKVIGVSLDKFVDIKGNSFGFGLCDAGQKPGGGWYEYWWPKPGEKEPSRKISFVLKAKGQPYVVIGGYYDEKITMDELNKLLK
jgi:hypothetical protein